MELDCAVEAPWPAAVDWEALAQRAARAISRIAPELDNMRLSVSIVFTDDKNVHALNREWRRKDKPTNVLSFPMLERAELTGLANDGPPEMLGDIAVAFQTCQREAEEKGMQIQDHATHLIIHGLLHLAGHDHETSPEDADAMELLEIKALAILGIEDPYGRLD